MVTSRSRLLLVIEDLRREKERSACAQWSRPIRSWENAATRCSCRPAKPPTASRSSIDSIRTIYSWNSPPATAARSASEVRCSSMPAYPASPRSAHPLSCIASPAKTIPRHRSRIIGSIRRISLTAWSRSATCTTGSRSKAQCSAGASPTKTATTSKRESSTRLQCAFRTTRRGIGRCR